MREGIEELASKFHDIYQEEARRQGDVRHQDAYEELPENVKEFDRVLARYMQARLSAAEESSHQFESRLIATRAVLEQTYERLVRAEAVVEAVKKWPESLWPEVLDDAIRRYEEGKK